MLRLSLHPVDLPLRHAWTIAHGTRTVQHNLIVALHNPDTGHTGYGEAPAIPYMGVTVAGLIDWLQHPFIEHIYQHLLYEPRDWKPHPPDGRWDEIRQVTESFADHAVHDPLPQNWFALSALDQAAHDLWGKWKGVPTRDPWKFDNSQPPSDYTLGLAPPENMVAKLREFPGFPIYKIKLGTPSRDGGVAHDLALVKRLREETDATFRVDANTAWTAEETIRISGPLRELDVEFIEQPLKPNLPRSEHDAVFFGSDLPIIADESCQTEADVEKCAGLFHGINIKLSKCGGLTPARRMIAHARKLGLTVMAGCMTETTVGISALAQLLPLLDAVDMDGALLLADGADVADGVKLGRDGRAVFPDTPGNGVTLTRELPTAER